MKKQKIKETDLAFIITQYLKSSNRELFAEVQCWGGTITDLVVRENKLTSAIEFKTSFGLAVIAQAVHNKKYYSYSYVAVPKCKVTFAHQVCKDYGIGIIQADLNKVKPSVQIVLPAKLNEKVKPAKLRDFQKLNQAGVQSDRITSFKYFVQSVEDQLTINENGMTHIELFRSCYKHYLSHHNLKNALLQYIKEGVIKRVEYRDKKFYLTLETINI